MDARTNGPPLSWLSVKIRPGFSTGHVDLAVWEGGYGQRSRCVLELQDTPTGFTKKTIGEIEVAVMEALVALVGRVATLDTEAMF